MKYRLLALLPLLTVPLLFAITAVVPAASEGHVLGVANEVGKVLSLMGALAAAFAFERGEYMGRAWLLFALCYVLLLANDATGLATPTATTALAGGILVVLANALSVVSIWMLARAWNVAGFEDDAHARREKRRVRLAALAVVVAITAWPLLSDLRSLVHGETAAIVSTGSDLGDMLTLALIAPVMQTALAMRGGLLRWPWGLMTAGSLGWLFYDVTTEAVLVLHVDHGALLVGSESVRLLAGGWIFAAGLSQRMVLLEE